MNYNHNNPDWWERTTFLYDSLHTDLFYKYDSNFKGKTIYYRDKMMSLLPDIKIDRFTLSNYEHPTNPLGIGEVISNLEFLAYKLTNVDRN